MDLTSYRGDVKTKSAVERQMQILTEAAYRLDAEAEALCPEPKPDWVGLRGMGNVLRHAYHKVDDEVIWNAVQDELPNLKRSVTEALAILMPHTPDPSESR